MTTPHVVSDEQLGLLARRQNDLFRRVREGSLNFEEVKRGLQDLIEGNFGAIPAGLRRLIDGDALPYIPETWAIERHIKGGEIEFDPSKVTFYMSETQRRGKNITGNDLMKEVEKMRVMNACVLDHLLANTNLIPEAWKTNDDGTTRYILFPGTTYRYSGFVCVRSLYWGGGQWRWVYNWLDDEFDALYQVAVSAS